MPAYIKHKGCRSCGHHHHFCLPTGELTPAREYGYVCPETGVPETLRPETPGEAVQYYPQGAVALSAAGQGKRAA